jgi:HEPN domain-containing protein
MDPRLELSRLLLHKASDDLAMARQLAVAANTPEWGIGFHVQQAVEKALKAVPCMHGIEYPRTHSISLLLDLLAEHSLHVPVSWQSLVVLTPYGVLFRYDETGPTDAEMANLPDRASLLSTADAVINWASAAMPK